MRLWVFSLLIPVLLTACLELTPNVSTEFSEVEARAVFEREIRMMCDHKKARIPRILTEIDESEAEPTEDHWIFRLEEGEALVYPSGVATGAYLRHVWSTLCR